MKKFFISGVVLVSLLMVVIFAYGDGLGKDRPDSIREELWQQSLQISIFVKNAADTAEGSKDGDWFEVALEYKTYAKNLDNITDDEKMLIEDVSNLITFSTDQVLFRNLYNEDSEDYVESLKEVEDWFGASNLEYENYDPLVISSYFEEVEEQKIETDPVRVFMKDNNISLTAKDVQYDMSNNLDKEFVISGNAELNDYYNYGFDSSIEDDYFNVRLTPDDGSDSWSLYFERDAYSELFEDLKQNDVSIIVSANIPSWIYEKNQGNMAFVSKAKWSEK